MEKKQVVVGEYENELDAEIAKGHLEASGIEASIIKGGWNATIAAECGRCSIGGC